LYDDKVNLDAKLANDFKNSLGSDSYIFFSATNQVQQWSNNWLADSSRAQFKVVYDRNAQSIHVIGYWAKAIRLDEVISVQNEANLPEILDTVRILIKKATQH